MNYTVFKSRNKDKFLSQYKENQVSNTTECLWDNSPFHLSNFKSKMIDSLWLQELPKSFNITEKFNISDIIHYNTNEGHS